MDSRLRILDACSNRAREALRTMEDVARFHLGERGLCQEIKSLRHGLRDALESIPGGALRLIASRDTPGDVGTSVKGTAEGERIGLRDVAIAAGKRAGEALRTLEETAKTIEDAPGLWTVVEPLRYRLYEVEKRLVLAMGTGRARQYRLCVLITESLCRRPWLDVAAAAMAGGADCLQLREPHEADGVVLNKALQLQRLVDQYRAHGTAARVDLVVNNRVDIALMAGADGVHLGTGDLPIAAARELCGDRLLIGASTHTLEEARAAIEAGADMCGVGAMFAGTTKQRETSGAEYLRAYLAEFGHVPHLAIGGITPANAPSLVEAGARGLAVSSVVCGDDDPERVCRELLAALPPRPPPPPASRPTASR
jgi:thiamine-phosphate pyrophosphorylase